jgi:hypothetical protein
LKLPLFRIPISRKLVLGALAGAVGALLQALGIYSVSPQVQGWISTGEFLLVGAVVPEAVKFLDYAAERIGLSLRAEDTP